MAPQTPEIEVSVAFLDCYLGSILIVKINIT